MRPKKTRWVKCAPGERCFLPRCKPVNKGEAVYLTLDEFEAIRLADLEALDQMGAAGRMRISRPTFSRILSSAHHKVADGLVNIKAIKIEGGCCKIEKKTSYKEKQRGCLITMIKTKITEIRNKSCQLRY